MLSSQQDSAGTEVAELSSKNARMASLIKDMAGQMEVLQAQLAKQTGLVVKLEEAVHAQGAQAAAEEEDHRAERAALK